METLTLTIPSETVQRLTRQANHRGMDLPAFIVSLADEAEQREQLLDRSTNYLLEKNAELYRRLAQ